MISLVKRAAASFVAVAGGLLMITGLLLDVPEAISRVVENGPTWLNNPDVWWVVGISVITGIVLLCVWRNPDSSAKGFAHPEAALFEAVMNQASRAAKKYDRLHARSDQQATKQFLKHELQITMPTLLDSLFGKKGKDEFIAAMNSAEQLSGGEPAALIDAYIAHLGSFCTAGMVKLTAKMKKELTETRAKLAAQSAEVPKLQAQAASSTAAATVGSQLAIFLREGQMLLQGIMDSDDTSIAEEWSAKKNEWVQRVTDYIHQHISPGKAAFFSTKPTVYAASIQGMKSNATRRDKEATCLILEKYLQRLSEISGEF